VPCGDTTFVPHNCFLAREANTFYSLDLVQPVVHPYGLWGSLKDSPWYSFYSVFPTRQWSEIEDYIKIYAINGDPYDPYDTNTRLPKEHRQFIVCAQCGRQAQDCFAMGSMVNFNPPFDQPSYVACVSCSTHKALVAFMDTDLKWFDALQLRVSFYSKDSFVLLACVYAFLHLLHLFPLHLHIACMTCLIVFLQSCCMRSSTVHQHACSS